MNDEDLRHMATALELARRGQYSTSPNPCVGCVLVKHGRVIARGYHRRAGGPHAEVDALRQAGADARGATAYVSLEPCNHSGRTPPCTEALIKAGIARVVYAIGDPNPSVDGAGGLRLRAAAIEVVAGVRRDEAALLNRGFFERMQSGRPRVRVKIAMSLDGGAALSSGESQWITGREARADVQRLRAESCAIVTGIGTVLADDPALDVRDERYAMAGRQPHRVVLDSGLRMPATARLLTRAGETWVFCAAAVAGHAQALRAAGARVETLAQSQGRIDLAALLARLGQLEVNELLVEAGPTLAGAFIETRCFDELILYVAPKLLGASARRALALTSPATLAQAMQLRMLACDRIGEDLRLVLGVT